MKNTIKALKIVMTILAVLGCGMNILGGVGMRINSSESERVRAQIASHGDLLIAAAVVYLLSVIIIDIAKNMPLMAVGTVLSVTAAVMTAVSVSTVSRLVQNPDIITGRHLPTVLLTVFAGLIAILFFFSDEQKEKRRIRRERDNAEAPSILGD